MAAALLLLIGGSIALASQALPRGTGRDSSLATAPPPPPPALLAPAATLTSAPTIDIGAVRPSGLRSDQHYRLRVYVNGNAVREGNLPADDQFVIPNVPLDEGPNAIRVSLVGDGGEGARSAPVSITLDDVAPTIRVTQPAADGPIYGSAVTLRGRTEAGADIAITDLETGHDLASTVDGDGHFSAALTLSMGANHLVLRSTDQAGNKSSSRVTLTRAQTSANISLTLNPSELSQGDLPATMAMTAEVRDDLGRLADNVQVTFSISPPDSTTMTYRTTTSAGKARWNQLVIDPGDTPGEWLVTVLAVLPSGSELRDDASFSLR